MDFEISIDVRKLPPAVFNSVYHLRRVFDFDNEKVLIFYDRVLHRYLDLVCEGDI